MVKEAQTTEEVANNQFADWDSPSETFFENTEVTPVETIVNEVLEDKVLAVETPREEDPESKEDEDYVFQFGNDKEDEEEDEESSIENKTKTSSAKLDSKSTLEFLKEKGLVSYELEEGTELTNDIADEILEDSYEASVDAGVAEAIKDLPEAVKELIKFVNKGGDYTQMLGNLAKQSVSGISKDTDMDVENNQILVLTQDLKDQGYDEEFIQGQVDYFKESGKLKGIADKLFTKVLAKQENELTQRSAAQAAIKADNKEKQRVYKSEITTQLGSLEDIKGVVLNKQDKENLPSYISDANVKLQDGRVVTKFQQELFSVFGNKEKTILLAKLIKSDFDFSSIANKEITKYSKTIKENIQNNNVTIKGSKGSSQKQNKKSLADLLD